MSGSPRSRLSFNDGWLFLLGDRPEYCGAAFDDSAWRALTLPHDWGVEHPVAETNPTGLGGGYALAGVGWYRKHFRFDEGWRGKRVALLFDGVYMDSTVWLNGKPVGGHGYGYTSFSVDLTDGLLEGENVLAVRADNSRQPNSRWYSGSGITHGVWLEATSPIHIAQWGVFCSTNALFDATGQAQLNIKAWVTNESGAPADLGVLHRLRDKDGQQVSFSAAPLRLSPGEAGETMTAPVVVSPHLWTDDDPFLYTLETTVVTGGETIDAVTTRVGIRTAEFDADRGFLLNGKSVKIKGMCVHQDCGLAGAAFRAEIWERRLRLLKEMGCNGIRCAHNPPDPAFLELCDELGFLVLDEAFDEWLLTKDKTRNYYSETFGHGYSEHFALHAEEDLVAMLRRDRNHPSVILWSVGNEIPEQASHSGVETLKRLRELCRSEDPTRMVTAACDNIAAAPPATALREFENELDVVGYNYVARWRGRAETLYDEDRALFPRRRFLGTENPSVGGFRGVYGEIQGMPEYLRRRSHLTAMLPCEWLWRYTVSRDFVAGDYLWTGVDYLGEAPWPCRGAAAGPIDTAGFPKDAWHYFRSIWKRETPTLHLFPHWNWAGREGEFLQVVAYTSCDQVRLFLNGRLVGAKAYSCPNPGAVKAWNDFPAVTPTTHDLHLVWDVPYEPGELKAVGYRGGTAVAEAAVRTTKKPAALRAVADKAIVSSGSLAQIEVSAVDEDGLAVPDAENLVRCEVTGPARLLGMDSGDLLDHTLYGSLERRLFSGLLLAAVEAQGPGEIQVRFSSEGLEEAVLRLETLI